MIEVRKSITLLAFSKLVLHYNNVVDDYLIKLTQKFNALLFYRQAEASNE